ncbi:Dyp-type peroxidase [Marinactinospora rubrisoli]|uniref:Dyp-type peroxidase n=1 Tax=Marinactinospora rubrisoli TaxID=2715399 RepID=A0ABW2KBA9_9ACTN
MTRHDAPAPMSRRGLLATAGAAGLTGLGSGLGAGEILRPLVGGDTAGRAATERLAMASGTAATGSRLQPGVAGAAPAFVHVIALDLVAPAREAAEPARAAAAAVLRTWSTEADRLMADGPAAAVAGAASAGLLPASLAVTVGLGGALLDAIGRAARRPEQLADLPAFATDELREEWCGGDLLLQVGAEDPMVLAAAVQHLVSAVTAHTRIRWSLRGFQRTAAAARDPAATPRNLMGQLDGTGNPPRDEALFAATVRARPADGPAGWMAGGSYLVVRRIRMLLDDWYALDAGHRERVVGRHLDTGAPLGGRGEGDDVPLHARDSAGRPRIPADAHVRLASPESNLGARMFRRGYSFDEGWRADGTRDAGLLFMAWQADPSRAFVPVQQRLADGGDALNAYIRHEGSALFAVPPVPDAGRHIAQDLVED